MKKKSAVDTVAVAIAAVAQSNSIKTCMYALDVRDDSLVIVLCTFKKYIFFGFYIVVEIDRFHSTNM